jgi:hypothetical protein
MLTNRKNTNKGNIVMPTHKNKSTKETLPPIAL